jgi:hypothetical protein
MFMKLIQKPKFSRTTKLVQRVRKVESGGTITLTTAADVFGYQNLAFHLKGMGFTTHARRHGSRVVVYVNTDAPSRMPRCNNTALKKVLLSLKKGDDCLALTTPKEMYQFNSLREWLANHYHAEFKLMRNCTDVWVWRR